MIPAELTLGMPTISKQNLLSTFPHTAQLTVQRETIGRARLPREIVQQERGARCRKDGAGRNGGSPVQNEPQDHSTNATREGHTGLLQKADCRLQIGRSIENC